MKIKVSKILNKTDLGMSGSHGGLVVYREDIDTLMDFFELPNKEQTFTDLTDGEQIIIHYVDYSKNGTTPNDRITPIGRYATKHKLEPGDQIILEKHIDENNKKYFINYIKKNQSIIFNGKSNLTVEVTNESRFTKIINNNLKLGFVKETRNGEIDMVVTYDGSVGTLRLKNYGNRFEITFNMESLDAYRKYFELNTKVSPFELKQISTWNYFD